MMRQPVRRWLLRTALVAALVLASWQTWRGLALPREMAAYPCPPAADYVGSAIERSEWADLCRYRTANLRLIESGERPDTVMLGDSITEWWSDADPELFGNNLPNRGIAGQTSAQLLVRMRSDVIALRPRRVHILVGLNDIAGNTGLTTPQGLIDNIESMIDLARANGIEPVVGLLTPSKGFGKLQWIEPGRWIADVNRRLVAMANRRGIRTIDYHAALAKSGGEPDPELFSDYGHPNAVGYARMSALLRAELSRPAEAIETSNPEMTDSH